MSKMKKCIGKEAFQRMNYLLQISNSQIKVDNSNNNHLSTLYTQLLLNVSRKTVQRIEPNIKRIICKGCKSMLVAGATCKVRIKKKQVVYRCNLCGMAKKFPSNPDYKLWLEQDESVAETLNYEQNRHIQSQSTNKLE